MIVASHRDSERKELAPPALRRSRVLLLLTGLWLVIYFASLFAPPVLDDADGTHASAARHMALSGDLVTLKVDGIRYLEKAPLPYWLVAASFRIFGFNTFAVHLPNAIAVLLLAFLGVLWADRAFGIRAALYTGIAVLTSAGVFLFTRIYIPEVMLSLFLCAALYCLASALDKPEKMPAYAMWTALALAVLTKGLVALVFFFGTAGIYLLLTGDYKRMRALRPVSGFALFLAIAAPWHILAGLRNTGGMNGHGFFWFYFVNEHVLRFLGRRYPVDYNKLPGYLYWSLHLVWLFPWSLFLPVACLKGYRGFVARRPFSRRAREHHSSFTNRSILILALYSALVLLFFAISTNQEYYTFPAYLPLLMFTMAAICSAEQSSGPSEYRLRRWLTAAHAAYTVAGVAVAAALVYGLWSSRRLPFVPDIGVVLAHRGVGDYTLSMSSFFDLTGPSFAALRLPAVIAAITFATGPAVAWILRSRRRHLASMVAVAGTSAVFLIAAQIAFVRFAPVLSSENLAAKIQQLEDDHVIARDSRVILYGDQAYGSSIPFYLGKEVELVNGRSTSMLFGSAFADVPPVFLTPDELFKQWGGGPARMVLFVPPDKRDEVDQLLGKNKILIEAVSGKALFTDRPLDAWRTVLTSN
ncbi:MAG: glycosyltransferase family 39 protein [Acidobacteriaceae bacterium]|nr:glycosyltransferase family 39 protein [Acidobacteriaceae bacterium]